MPRGIPNKPKNKSQTKPADKGQSLEEKRKDNPKLDGDGGPLETMSSDPEKQPDLHLQGNRKDLPVDTTDLHLQRNTSSEKQAIQRQASDSNTATRIDTQDLYPEKKSVVDDTPRGLIDRSAINDEPLGIVGAAGAGEYARDLAFFEELVEVEVHESTDPNAEAVVDLYCNGVSQRFIRGVPLVVKRKYVQILATAKPQTISTRATVSGDEVINRITKHTALRYPFRVIRDDNPKGADWLRETLLNG